MSVFDVHRNIFFVALFTFSPKFEIIVSCAIVLHTKKAAYRIFRRGSSARYVSHAFADTIIMGARRINSGRRKNFHELIMVYFIVLFRVL